MTKQTCAICDTKHDEVWTCESCGKRVCADHIVNVGDILDDINLKCTDCLEAQYDNS